MVAPHPAGYVAESGRERRGFRLYIQKQHMIRQVRPGLYWVPSATVQGEGHWVDANRQFCSCTDYQIINSPEYRDRRGVLRDEIQACKHIVAVGCYREELELQSG
jgi:hypothetical protein